MTRFGRLASRWRWLLLIVGMAFEIGAVAWVLMPYVNELFQLNIDAAGLAGTPLIVAGDSRDSYLISALAVVGLLLIAQWAFLRPSRLLAIRLTVRGRPMWPSVVVAGAMSMLLTIGGAAVFLEILSVWSIDSAWMARSAIWLAMLTVWAAWAVLFFRYWRDGDRYTQLGKVVRALVAGSLLEAVVAVPVQAYAARKEECYCALGSYTTLVCSGAVLFWAFGPGIVLLFLRERYRRMRLFPHCHNCGYDLRGGLHRCPECGTAKTEGAK